MPASLGVWAEGSSPFGVLYRWEADQGAGASGFVAFDPVTRQFRPTDRSGAAVGDLIIDAASGEMTGSSDGIDRVALAGVAASILRAFARSGEPPRTAHAYFH